MKRPSKLRVTREPPRRRSTAEKAVRDLVARALADLDFVHPAIPTEVTLQSDGLHVRIDIVNRETGDPALLDFRSDLPPLVVSRDHAIDWIYGCVRDAWVHELNEALFVDGARRHDLHDGNGKTLPPPDEAARSELDSFKVQLAGFLMGGVR